jgi:hypothetical protein
LVWEAPRLDIEKDDKIPEVGYKHNDILSNHNGTLNQSLRAIRLKWMPGVVMMKTKPQNMFYHVIILFTLAAAAGAMALMTLICQIKKGKITTTRSSTLSVVHLSTVHKVDPKGIVKRKG